MKSLTTACLFTLISVCCSITYGQVPDMMYAEFSPDGKLILTADFENMKFRLFDAVSKKFIAEINSGFVKPEPTPDDGRAIIYVTNPALARFSADGKSVALLNNHTLVSWDIATKKVLLRVKDVYYCDLSYNRQWLVFSKGFSMLVYNTNTWKVWKTFKAMGQARLSPDAKMLAVSNSAMEGHWDLKFYDLATGKAVKTVAESNDYIHYLRFSPDGKLLVYSNDASAREAQSQLMFVDPASGKLLDSLKGNFNTYFSPDGKKMITMSFTERDEFVESVASVWSTETRKLALKLDGHDKNLNAVMFNFDGTKIGTSSDDGQTIIWDAATGEQLATVVPTADTQHMELMAFDRQGKFVITAIDGQFSISDVVTGEWLFGLVGDEVTTEVK